MEVLDGLQTDGAVRVVGGDGHVLHAGHAVLLGHLLHGEEVALDLL